MNDYWKALAKRSAITVGLEASALLSTLTRAAGDRGRGAIFTLHHVRPWEKKAFHPNDLLEITPDFLDVTLQTLGQEGYEFISLDDVPARLARDAGRPFACFTLDDGYRDNAAYAADVFTRHGAPFTIFLTGGFVDATRSMWWETLEAVLSRNDSLPYDFGNGAEMLAAGTVRDKSAAFNRIAAHINSSDELEAIAALDDAATRLGTDPLGITADLTMRQDELAALLANPLAAYGAHTMTHRGIARLTAAQSEAEIADSVAVVAAITGRRPVAFAYP